MIKLIIIKRRLNLRQIVLNLGRKETFFGHKKTIKPLKKKFLKQEKN